MQSKVKLILHWSVFVLAVAITTGWLVLCFVYLSRLGWDGLMSLEPGALAATLAAAAGPPVALWLILVVTAQRQELVGLKSAVLDFGLAVRRGQHHAESQGRALLEISAASQRKAAKDELAIGLDDLASHASVVAERLGVLEPNGILQAWERYGSGDRWALMRPFIDRAAAETDFGDRLAGALEGDAVSQLAASAFVRRLDLLRGDGAAGEQKLIHEILVDGPVVQVARLFTKEEASVAEADVSNADEDQGQIGGDQSVSIEGCLGPQPTLFQPDSKTA